MYDCFKPIPQGIRQRAFDKYIAGRREYLINLRNLLGYTPVYILENGTGARIIGGHMCCPLGAINNELYGDDDDDFLQSGIYMPANGSLASSFLLKKGIVVSEHDAQYFITDNDQIYFTTFQKLADAMGVTYTPEQEG